MSRLLSRAAWLALLVVLGGASSPLGAAGPKVTYDPQVGGVTLVQKGDVDGKVASQFEVTARGQREVDLEAGNVTGVLLQAAARPDGAIARPIRLSYRLRGEHDATLVARIGQTEATSDSPAWVWAVAARFALHRATGAVTLTDHPQTAAEKIFAEGWRKRASEGDRLVWARYHPVLEDTLVGFHLVVADAMMADAEHMHTVVGGLSHTETAYGQVSASDTKRSLRNARMLDALMRLESKPGDCVMLNDVKSDYTFALSEGKLEIRGTADYHFARPVRGQRDLEKLPQLTRIFQANRHVFRESSATLYHVVEDFGRLVSFFNYVKEADRDQLAGFAAQLEPVLGRIPTIETPIAVPLRATTRP